MMRLFGQKPGSDDPPAPVPRPGPADRVYAVGDVHGRADLLEVMLRRIAADFAFRIGDGRRPKVIVLGDIIDRGDNSREVVRMLMRIAGRGPLGDLTVLMGNHEAAMLGFLDAPDASTDWIRFGGLQTLASYGVPVPAGPPDPATARDLAARLRDALGDHLPFLQSLPLSWRSGDVLCTHAGIDPGDPDGTDEDVLLWGSAAFPETGPVPGLRVVHGHYDAPEPVVTAGRICVDTGAYYTGRLTAVRLDEGTGLITAGR